MEKTTQTTEEVERLKCVFFSQFLQLCWARSWRLCDKRVRVIVVSTGPSQKWPNTLWAEIILSRISDRPVHWQALPCGQGQHSTPSTDHPADCTPAPLPTLLVCFGGLGGGRVWALAPAPCGTRTPCPVPLFTRSLSPPSLVTPVCWSLLIASLLFILADPVGPISELQVWWQSSSLGGFSPLTNHF